MPATTTTPWPTSRTWPHPVSSTRGNPISPGASQRQRPHPNGRNGNRPSTTNWRIWQEWVRGSSRTARETKARWMSLGIQQVPGIDYFDTFSPVVRLKSLRALLAIAAAKDLNGDLQEEVFMEQPPGFDDGSGRKCRLKKTLYGLKQSGREWNRKLHSILTKHGFERLEVDHGVYCFSATAPSCYPPPRPP